MRLQMFIVMNHGNQYFMNQSEVFECYDLA